MDYSTLHNDGEQTLIHDLTLALREVSEGDLEELLNSTDDGRTIHKLIKSQIPAPKTSPDWEDEFGGEKAPTPQATGTWTLVVLSSLKTRGKEIKKGIVRRMIQTALPLGAELNIVLNGEVLSSTKASVPLIADWQIGPSLGLTELLLPPREGAEADEPQEKIAIQSKAEPFPHLVIS
jgi:hypothetical protein